MAETHYDRFIFTDINTGKDDIGTLMYSLDEQVVRDIPFFTCAAWVWPKDTEIIMEEKAHTHEFDEVVALFGSNPEDPRDLCGDVEFWMDGRKHLITKSCMIYIPQGVEHCPIIFRKVKRPIFHYLVANAGRYVQIK